MSALGLAGPRKALVCRLQENIHAGYCFGKEARRLGCLPVSELYSQDKEQLMKLLSVWSYVVEGCQFPSAQLGLCLRIIKNLRHHLSYTLSQSSFTDRFFVLRDDNNCIQGVVQLALIFRDRAYGQKLSGPSRPLHSSLTVQNLCVSPEGMVDPEKKIPRAGLMIMIKVVEIALFYNIASITLTPTSHSKVIETYKSWGFVADKEKDMSLSKSEFIPLLKKLQEKIAGTS